MIGAEAEFKALEPLTPPVSPEEKRNPSVPADVNPGSLEWLAGAPTEPRVWEA